MKKIIYLRNIEVSADEKIISNDSYIQADDKIFVHIFRRQRTTGVLQCVRLKYGDLKWTKFKEMFY